MKQFYENEYRSGSAHRSHARRRTIKNLSTVFLILGLLCAVISVVIFATSFLSRPSAQNKMRVLSLVYAGSGVVLLGLRWISEIVRNRESDRRTGRSASKSSAYYYPQKHNHVRRNDAPPEPPNDNTTPRDGMALILVLILLALIAGLVLEIQINARTALRRDERVLLRTRLEQAAADAARAALQRLADDPDLLVDGTNETWAATQEVTDPTGIATRAVTTDENRRFDLNNLAAAVSPSGRRPASEIVMDLMTLCGDFGPVERVDALTDWVDDNDEGGAETRYYRDQTPPYLPANRPLLTWHELLWIRGFTRELFARHPRSSAADVYSADLVDCVAVIPATRTQPIPLNVNTADKDALLGVLGIGRDELARSILNLRAGEPIRSLAPLLSVADPALAEDVRPYLDVKSSLFTVDAQAYAGGQSVRLRVLARRSSQGDVEVLQWVF